MKSKKQIFPAQRVSEIKEYYFSRKLREVAKLNAEGHDIISLGIGGPDRMPSADVIETLRTEVLSPSGHSYQSYTGAPELRRAYSRWYQNQYGVALDPDKEILPLIGSKEGILHITLAFVNPGDAVLVPDPGYPTYTSVSRMAGARVVPYQLTAEGGWMPDFDALEKLDLSNVKIMWANYPHMPTGTPASLELFGRLIDFGRRHGILIVNDNPYSHILNASPLSILSIDGARDTCIELNSLSKSHNMAGWRMGVAVANPEFIGWILKVKSNVDSGQFRPMMLAAAKALDAPESWYADLNAVYASRRRIAEDIMTAAGCSFDSSQRGLFLWGRIPDDCESGEQLADRLLYEARVFVTPGIVFGTGGDRYIRISLCADETHLSEALQRIRSISSHDPKQ